MVSILCRFCMNFLVNLYLGIGIDCMYVCTCYSHYKVMLLLFCRAVLLSLHLACRYLFCSKCFLEMPGETVSIGEDGYTPT